MNDTPTPITDKGIVWVGAGFDMYGRMRDGSPYVKPEVCRKLERENARLLAALKKLPSSTS